MEAQIEYGLLRLGYMLILVGLAMTIVGFVRKHRRWRLVGLGLVFFGVLLLVRQAKTAFWGIDGCLDSGGRWDAALQRCEYSASDLSSSRLQ